MRFEAFIAARYLRGKRKYRFVSLITIISVAGVSVGVIALIVVMAVMTGFDIELRNTIIGNRAHLTVFNMGRHTLADPDQVIADIRALCPEITGAGPLVQEEALLKNGRYTSGALILGIDPEREKDVTDLATNLTDAGYRTRGRGTMPGNKEVVLGYRLADRIGATVGSEIAVYTANTIVRPLAGRGGRPLYMRVSGISEAMMSEYDQVYAFVNIPTALMISKKTGVDAVNVKLSDPFLADAVAERIEDKLPYRVDTWYKNNEPFLAALEQEKLAMFVILTFIILVAAFNITSTLIMVVMEKRRDIGILRTLGARGSTIVFIFVIEGLMIGLGGTALGLVLGIALALNLNPVVDGLSRLLGRDPFPDVIYYFDKIPVAIMPWDIFWVALAAVLLSLVSTLYPALSAMRLDPVDALRYE